MRVASMQALRVASRQSDLARIQAYLVAEALRRAHPGILVEHHFRESLGDQNQSDPLWKMPERGVFTQDFLGSLISGDTDLVVHSWKDLPVEDRPETEIVATLPRADARDLLLVKRSTWARVQRNRTIQIFSSSPRRARNLASFLLDHLPVPLTRIEFASVRGNVPTRIRKLVEDESVDGLIVAKAALDRLLDPALQTFESIPPEEREKFAATAAELSEKLRELNWMVLPLAENPTAAAQGALAIEIRKDRDDLRRLLAPIHCEATARAVRKEREILKSHGGGCHQKIGVTVLPRIYGELVFLRGETEDGVNLDIEPDSSSVETAPSFFERENLPFDAESFRARTADRAIWVSRANALPAAAEIPMEQILWCAGPESWRKLAARGVWVNGSAESLGETEDPAIETLASAAGQARGGIRWAKLTHGGVPGMPKVESRIGIHALESIATYQLTPRAKPPKLSGKGEYYWMSGSNFLAAFRLYPEIAKDWHFCGPGRTYPAIREILGPSGKIAIQIRRKRNE